MKLVGFLEREAPWERYAEPIVPVEAENHRPRKRFGVKIRSAEDVRRARKMGLPLLLVTSEDLKMLRYPLRIPSTVLVPREFAGVLDSTLPVRVFQSMTPFGHPRIEDIAVFLLIHDPLAARAVIERNRELFDLSYLRKRILQEELEREATQIRLQEYVDVPAVGDALPEATLKRAARANRVTDVIP